MSPSTAPRPIGLRARIAAANTSCRIAAVCSGSQSHEVLLDSMSRALVLCDGCLEAARRLGMAPRPVPAWMTRSLARDETGRLAA